MVKVWGDKIADSDDKITLLHDSKYVDHDILTCFKYFDENVSMSFDVSVDGSCLMYKIHWFFPDFTPLLIVFNKPIRVSSFKWSFNDA